MSIVIFKLIIKFLKKLQKEVEREKNEPNLPAV